MLEADEWSWFCMLINCSKGCFNDILVNEAKNSKQTKVLTQYFIAFNEQLEFCSIEKLQVNAGAADDDVNIYVACLNWDSNENVNRKWSSKNMKHVEVHNDRFLELTQWEHQVR